MITTYSLEKNGEVVKTFTHLNGAQEAFGKAGEVGVYSLFRYELDPKNLSVSKEEIANREVRERVQVTYLLFKDGARIGESPDEHDIFYAFRQRNEQGTYQVEKRVAGEVPVILARKEVEYY